MADTPADELKLLRFLDTLDSESESVKRVVAKQWAQSIRQVRGDQWKVDRDPYFLANITKNQVRRKVSMLTETKPQMQIHGRKPGLSQTATTLYNVIRAIWDRSSTDDVTYKVCQFAMTVGSGFWMPLYDAQIDEIDVVFVDPRRVFIDPGISSLADIDRAQYVRIDSAVTLSDVRLRFPGRGNLVKPDATTEWEELAPRKSSVLSSLGSLFPVPYRPREHGRTGAIPRAQIREYWIRDPQINTEGDSLFPGGRHIVRAGGVILLDELNPYWDGGWPLVGMEWDVDYDRPWGLAEVPDLLRLQEAINRLGDAWVKNTLLGSNFKVIADVDALDADQWDKLDNDAGLVIRKRPQRTFEYQPPVPLGPEIPTSIQNLIQLCDLITGNTDPGPRSGSTSGQGGTLEGLQSARQVLIRSVARRLESALERLGQKLVSRVFQFYTSDRVLFQLGADRQWVAYTLERQKLLKDDDGKLRPVSERQKMFQDFQFMITPMSSLASTRMQRTMAMLQLRAATGVAPSLRRILGESDMGDPDEILKEGLEELKTLPPPPPAKGRGGRS